MSTTPTLNDLDLTALISSRICHDLSGAIGAINYGIDALVNDDDPEMREFALQTIHKSAKQAWAHLEFSRLAFGAAGSAGNQIALPEAKRLAEAYLGEGRHRLVFDAPDETADKNLVKLLLNLISIGQQVLPRGGEIEVDVSPGISTGFKVTCRGDGARIPDNLQILMPEADHPEGSQAANGTLDARSIQAYFSGRIAQETGLVLSTSQAQDVVIFTATPNTAVPDDGTTGPS